MGASNSVNLARDNQPSELSTSKKHFWSSGTTFARNHINILLSTMMQKSEVDNVEHSEESKTSRIWNEFTNFTTSHGIPHIDHARGKFKKALWITITLACLLGLIVNMYLLCSKYLKYGVDVKISVEQAKSMTFPAVTICNNNAIRKSAIYSATVQALKEINDSMNIYKNKIQDFNCTRNDTNVAAPPPPPPGYLSGPSGPAGSKPPQCVPTSGKTGDGREERIDFQLVNRIQEMYETLDDEIKYKIGHDIYNMIVDCEYAGGLCSMENDFISFLDNQYGNCYTFNSILTEQPLKTTMKSGPKNGFSITFNVEQEEYIGEISQSAGLRVVVHDPRRMPFPEDEGILVSPSLFTQIGIKMETISRLNGSYGNCYAEGLPKKTIFQKAYNLSYCQKGCRYTCLGEEIYRRCSCVDVRFNVFFYLNETRRICSEDNIAEKFCVFETLMSNENDSVCNDECTVPCREITFSPTVSSTLWPADNYKKFFYSYLESLYIDDSDISVYIPSNDTTSLNDIINANLTNVDPKTGNTTINPRNYGKVVIYFESLAYTIISESPSYEIQQLLSDIGGVLGLYIGFSLLTVVEFIVLLYDLSWAGLCTRCCQNSNRSVSNNNTSNNVNNNPNNSNNNHYNNKANNNLVFGNNIYNNNNYNNNTNYNNDNSNGNNKSNNNKMVSGSYIDSINNNDHNNFILGKRADNDLNKQGNNINLSNINNNNVMNNKDNKVNSNNNHNNEVDNAGFYY